MSGNNWLLHLMGGDTQDSIEYMLYSGFIPAVASVVSASAVIVSAIVFIVRHNCHVKHCWRMGHIDPAVHHPACKKHHSHGHKLGGTK